MTQYVKLAELVGDAFTVQSIGSYKYKKWDETNRKMLVSDTYAEGYRKIFPVQTDKGLLDMSKAQLSDVLVGSLSNGKSDPVGKTFNVKSNGQAGKDIRYYLNVSSNAATYPPGGSQSAADGRKPPDRQNDPTDADNGLKSADSEPPLSNYDDIEF